LPKIDYEGCKVLDEIIYNGANNSKYGIIRDNMRKSSAKDMLVIGTW